MRLNHRWAIRARAGGAGAESEPQDGPSSTVPESGHGRDAVAGGQGGQANLRLVRFRLVLALLAAAIVPIALGTPLMVRVGQEMQARVGPAESSAASVRVASQLDGLRDRLLTVRAIDVVAEAADGSRQTKTKAAAALDRVARPDLGIVTGVWLLDAQGGTIVASRIPALAGGQTDLPLGDARASARGALALPDGPGIDVSLANRSSGADLYLATAVPGGASGAASTVLLARLSVPALLAEAQTGIG